MLTGKGYLILILCICFSSSCTSHSQKTDFNLAESAWWVIKEFKSTENTIFNMPLKELNKDWRSISLLTNDFFIKHLNAKEYKAIEQSKLLFSLTKDLNGDLLPEEISVGIYQTQQDEPGRFIVIKQGEKIEFFSQSGFSGYSALYDDGNQLRWYKCMQCSDYDTVYWSGSEYIIE